MSDHIKDKKYIVVDMASILDRNDPHQDTIWMEAVNHHCFAGLNGSMVLERFWLTYCYDPFENLEAEKEAYANNEDMYGEQSPHGTWEDNGKPGQLAAHVALTLKDHGYDISRPSEYGIVHGYDGVLLQF